MSSGKLELRGVAKAYGAVRAVDGVSLSVAEGELVALLGPSGCGKTTTLRMVAGFVVPSEGQVLIGGRDVTRLPPYRRDTGMVFQSYALFPHLTVAQNIAFGLKRRGVARAEAAERVARMAGLMRLTGLENRLPSQLSGGQQQRVAVARALVISPEVVLLDEPFSNLDAQLRESTRIELGRVQRELGLTTLFVTHDQAEAMAIADRVAVMNHGKIVQIARPAELYSRPRNRFVAAFVGHANIFTARPIEGAEPGLMMADGGYRVSLAEPIRTGSTTLVLRPETISLGPPLPPAPNQCDGVVESLAFLGPTARIGVRVGESLFLVDVGGSRAPQFPPGTAVTASWSPSALWALED